MEKDAPMGCYADNNMINIIDIIKHKNGTQTFLLLEKMRD